MDTSKLSINVFGNIELSNEVMVSDPCYDLETWCQIKLDNVKPGIYNSYVVKSDEDSWGIRCSSLIVKHKDKVLNECTEFIEHKGEVGVDSGQAGIFDMSIYPPKPHVRNKENPFYDECCDITCSRMSSGILSNKKGIVSSSGYGDGGYSLFYSTDDEGQIDYMHIIFIGPELNDEDFESDEEFYLALSEELDTYFSAIHGLIFN